MNREEKKLRNELSQEMWRINYLADNMMHSEKRSVDVAYDFLQHHTAHLTAEIERLREWVSVSDGLPDDGQCVLTHSAEADQGCKETVGILVNGFFYTDDEYLVNVTHWKPLPEPPKNK